MAEPTPMHNVPCCLCGTEAYETLFEACDRVHGVPGMFSVVRCTECGLCRTLPQPDPDELAQWYPQEDYYAYSRRSAQRRRAADLALRALRWIPRPLVPEKYRDAAKRRPGRVLDVGCGSGSFLDKFAALGWETSGVELSAGAVELACAAGHDAHCGDFLSVPLPEASFDLVRMSHVLEHLHDPTAALRRARSLLRDDGTLVVRVPDIESGWARRFGQDWYGLEVPRHLWHFSRRTLVGMLESCSLQVEEIRTHTFCPIWSLIHHRARLNAGALQPTVFKHPAAWRRLAWQVGTALPRTISDLFRLGDEVIVSARQA